MNPWDNVPAFGEGKKYFNWLRSQTRRIWSRHPTKIAYKQSRRYKAPVGKNGKEVWASDCEICGCQCRNCEVDHISPGGSFHDWESYTEWAKRILWVSFEDIRELCPECHAIVTYQQATGLSWEEAISRKKVIQKMNQTAKQQKDELISLGYSSKDITNETMREKCYMELMEKGLLE